MNVSMNDPTNHKVYGYVTEEYFYKVLQRAKGENLYEDEHGRIDINKLIQLMWETFADGRYIIIPNHECREKAVDFIKQMEEENLNNAKMLTAICPFSPNDNNKVAEAVAEMIVDSRPEIKMTKEEIENARELANKDGFPGMLEVTIDAKPKRKSRAKPKVDIDPTLVDASANVTN